MDSYHGWKASGSGFKECVVCGETSTHRYWNNDKVEPGMELCQKHWKQFKKNAFPNQNLDDFFLFVSDAKWKDATST